MNWPEFRDLQRSYFLASVLDLEVPTDHMIFGALYQIANRERIKYILSGNNFVTEWLLPPRWYYSKRDLQNILGIHRQFAESKIVQSGRCLVLEGKRRYQDSRGRPRGRRRS